MTQAEQEEVKARIEKLVGEFGKKTAALEQKVTELEDEIQRKNEALEGFMAENEALKDELGGRSRRVSTDGAGRGKRRPAPRQAESLQSKIDRWKAEAR